MNTSPLMDHMDKHENHEPLSPTPVLPRLDRLDRLLELLEEKQKLSSGRHICPTTAEKADETEDQHLKKSLSSALDEVQHKGTLMERLAMLETRVFQLSLEMDEGNTSKSSSSTTVAGPGKLDHGFDASAQGKQDEAEVVNVLGRKSPLGIQGQESAMTFDTEQPPVQVNGRKQTKRAHKKWLKWFNPTCTMSGRWNKPLD